MQVATTVSSSLYLSQDLPFRTNAQRNDFLDKLLLLEIGGFLHGDLAERVNIHPGVGQVDSVVLDLDLNEGLLTFWEE